MSTEVKVRLKAIKVLALLLSALILVNATGIPKLSPVSLIANATTSIKTKTEYGRVIFQDRNYAKVEFFDGLSAKLKARQDKISEAELRREAEERRKEEKRKAEEEAKRKEEEAKKKAEEEKKKAEEKKEKEKIIETFDDSVWAIATVNYRTGPGTDYKRVGSVSAGDELSRTGITKNDWTEISINGKTYYVSSEYISEEEPVEEVVTYSVQTASGTKGDYQTYALSLFSQYGWPESELSPLILLWERESNWNPLAHNPYSGAHGIPQSLPASKMATEGADYWDNGYTQIRWGLSYIANRYGDPSGAWAHSEAVGWY